MPSVDLIFDEILHQVVALLAGVKEEQGPLAGAFVEEAALVDLALGVFLYDWILVCQQVFTICLRSHLVKPECHRVEPVQRVRRKPVVIKLLLQNA